MRLLIICLLLLAGHNVFAQESVILTPNNTVTFRGAVNPDSVNSAQLKLAQLVVQRGLSNYPIYLVLDSPGGSIDAGLSFIEFAKTVKNLKTITIFAASMASAIAEQLPGERLMLETGTFMFHRAYGGVEGYFEDGELEERLAYSKSIVRLMETKNAQRLSITLDAYKAKVRNEWWAFGSDAIKQKMADKIVSVKCSPELSAQKTVVEVNMLFFRAKVQYSNCPLMRTGTVLLPNKE